MSGPFKYDQQFFAPVSNVSTTADAELGSRRMENGNEYIYVYNTGNSDISVGRGAIVTATSGYSVVVSSTSMVDQFLGVCRHNTITTGAYGWLLTRGFANIVMDTAASAIVGYPLCAGNNGLWRQVVSGSSSPIPPLAQARIMTAAASGDSGVGAYIFCN